jgi:hypothetical protein
MNIDTLKIDQITNNVESKDTFIVYFDINSSELNINDIPIIENASRIDIQTWASPDGNKSFNDNLSNDRLSSITTDLKEKYPDIEFNTKSNGEDWDNFLELSNIEDISNIVFNALFVFL